LHRAILAGPQGPRAVVPSLRRRVLLNVSVHRFCPPLLSTAGRRPPHGKPDTASGVILLGRDHVAARSDGRVEPMPSKVTMYTTTWCGYCRRLKAQLGRDGIAITEVNIEETPSAAEYVMSVNGGNQTVPTVQFADGTAMTNPSAAQVKQKLAA